MQSELRSGPEERIPIWTVYSGWEGYQTSLVRAIAPLSTDQLAFRPAPHMHSVGEIVRHIGVGRLNWFLRMHAPGSEELASRILNWSEDEYGNRYVVEKALATEGTELICWLEDTWQMVDSTLAQWSVSDLKQTYRHTFMGRTYAVSRQWTIWRILSHDIHHGGQLSVLLYMQGIEPPDLGYLGGHLTEPPLAESPEQG